MFIISMPITFKIGDTAPARINMKPGTVTWRDFKTLAIGLDDARTIVRVEKTIDGKSLNFVCDAGDASPDFALI